MSKGLRQLLQEQSLPPQLSAALAPLSSSCSRALLQLDRQLDGVPPSSVVLGAAVATVAAGALLSLAQGCLRSDWRRAAFRFAISLPLVRGIAAKETDKETGQLFEKYHSRRLGSMQALPSKGMSKEAIMAKLRKGEAASRRWYIDGGARLSGAVYNADSAHWDLVSDVMRLFIVSNPLHIEEFL
jgi:hypothetical protein